MGAALFVLGLEVLVLAWTSRAPVEQLVEVLRLDRLITRAALLSVAAFTIGYLVDSERRRRRESAAITELIRSARLDAGLAGTLQSLMAAIARLFDAAGALLIVPRNRVGSRVSARL